MPRKSQAASAEECCAKCERDVAALRKEVAALKAALAKRPASGGDPRVDVLIEALTKNPGWSWAQTINEKLK
mgnify:CR=1 FL=1|tara:strand:+ start:16092 stop:16307 length:216 start_codon:yes stop_codon:yes gene_type:complete